MNTTPVRRSAERKLIDEFCARTFREKSNSEEILETLREIADNLEEDLKRTGYAGRTVVVKYKVCSVLLPRRSISQFDEDSILQLHTYESKCDADSMLRGAAADQQL